jgi:short-subunit dehydrogenase
MSDGIALVTGASAGLGVEFARQLAARGVGLLLVARREERLRALALELGEEHGVRTHVFAADLSEPGAAAGIEAFVRERELEVDWLVNNAGSAGPDLLEDRDWDEQRRFFELMMISVAELCHRFVPSMRERGFGRVINVSSFAARLAQAGGANYGPAKAYLVALSEELALTLRDTGVHVTALCPGFTHTEFHEAAGLMEMKRATPGFVWYDAATVVREGLEAVEHGKAIHVCGRIYRWLDPMAQSVWLRPLLKALGPRGGKADDAR